MLLAIRPKNAQSSALLCSCNCTTVHRHRIPINLADRDKLYLIYSHIPESSLQLCAFPNYLLIGSCIFIGFSKRGKRNPLQPSTSWPSVCLLKR